MGTKFDVRCGKWKTIVEAYTEEELKAKVRTALLGLSENVALGIFVFAKKARKRNEMFQIVCSTVEVFDK